MGSSSRRITFTIQAKPEAQQSETTRPVAPEDDFEFMYLRTMVRHERGTLLIMMALLAIVLIGLISVICWTWTLSRRFATPYIYQSQTVEMRWGPHGK